MGGLEKMKNVLAAGFLEYRNASENGRRWNSSTGTDPLNPFFVADSIAGKSSTEAFRMAAELSFAIADGWHAGLSTGLSVSQLSDNTDPRPRSNLSAIPVCMGLDFQPWQSVRLGAFAGVEIKSERMTYTVVSSGNNHQYFVMKGLGDYFRSSSLAEQGYNRECFALKPSFGINFQVNGGRWKYFAEAAYASGTEKSSSEQGKFKAGDYSSSEVSLHNRFSAERGNVLHNITLDASITNGEGWWYEQKKLTDTEHGSTTYYDVLSKDKIHVCSALDAVLAYRCNLQRSAFLASAGFRSEQVTHYNDSGAHGMSVNMATLRCEAMTGGIRAGAVSLLASGKLETMLPAGDNSFEGACNYVGEANIDTVYTEPLCSYKSTGRWGAGIRIDATIPASSAAPAGIAGLFVSASSVFAFGGKGRFTSLGTGIYLNF